MKFILYLFFLNVILFLPRYLLGLPRSWNPLRFLVANDTLNQKVRTIYFSRIIDPFRFSFEYSLLLICIYLLGLQGHLATVIVSFVAVVIFVFNIYVAVFLILLNKTPILKSDWFFMRESISIYKGYFVIISILLVLFCGLFSTAFFYLNTYFEYLEFDRVYAIGFLAFILINGLYNVKYYNVTDYLSRVVFSLGIFILKSGKQTKRYNKLYDLTNSDIEKHNLFSAVSLRKKPNIHIISMESYGSVLFKDKDQYSGIVESISNWDEKFKHSDINCYSSFAVPPLFATGTWYSYSTLLFGMPIENGAKHNILFSEMANFSAYESLFQFTKNEGYTNFLLQGMIGDFEGTLDFEKLKKNLNYDRLIYNKELEYNGKLLKFMNLQNCVPDQYTFNRGLDIAKQSDDPYTMFYCTLNSHWDFYSPLNLMDDWEMINDPSVTYATTTDNESNRKERYHGAIQYTIDSVFDTILKRMSTNDIFIVYGDHQPTMITDEKYGKETPMHIFSKNKEFVHQWEEYGFKEGLMPHENKNPIKFEAFYSAFMRSLNKCYGTDVELDIPFLADGIELMD